MKLRILRSAHPRLPGWALNSITNVLIGNTQRRNREEEKEEEKTEGCSHWAMNAWRHQKLQEARRGPSPTSVPFPPPEPRVFGGTEALPTS